MAVLEKRQLFKTDVHCLSSCNFCYSPHISNQSIAPLPDTTSHLGGVGGLWGFD